MKTRLSMYLRNVAYAMLVTASFCSCTEDHPNKETSFDVGVGSGLVVVRVIDSCEYLLGAWGNATVLTHKGNCKFCAKRIKTNYDSLVKIINK
jgi:hypothetical protein